MADPGLGVHCQRQLQLFAPGEIRDKIEEPGLTHSPA